MKCYQFMVGQLTEGLSVVKAPHSERPYVYVGAGLESDCVKVLFSDELRDKLQDRERKKVFREDNPILLSCDCEDRGDQWLIPETSESKDDALVLASLSTYGLKQRQVITSFEFSENCRVFVDNQNVAGWQSINRKYKVQGRAALVRMPPGSWIRWETVVKKHDTDLFPKWGLDRKIGKIVCEAGAGVTAVSASGASASFTS